MNKTLGIIASISGIVWFLTTTLRADAATLVVILGFIAMLLATVPPIRDSKNDDDPRPPAPTAEDPSGEAVARAADRKRFRTIVAVFRWSLLGVCVSIMLVVWGSHLLWFQLPTVLEREFKENLRNDPGSVQSVGLGQATSPEVPDGKSLFLVRFNHPRGQATAVGIDALIKNSYGLLSDIGQMSLVFVVLTFALTVLLYLLSELWKAIPRTLTSDYAQ